MNKICSLNELVKNLTTLRSSGQIVGLVTGGFDLVHIGHIELFRYAKQHCDVLVVGLESDRSLHLTKGPHRPIFTYEERSRFLSEFSSVDFIFEIEDVYNYMDIEAEKVHEQLIIKIKPNYLITTKESDKYWKSKQLRGKRLGIKTLFFQRKTSMSSSKLIRAIRSIH